MKHSNRRDDKRRASREWRTVTVICIFLALVILALGSYAAGWYMNRARVRRDAERYSGMYELLPTPTPVVTAVPTDTPQPTEAPAPTDTPAPAIAGEPTLPAVVDERLATPNPDTLVYALPTSPPVQESFAELIAHNPDTVGFLTIGGMLNLPVVQRQNDNEYYLTHNFDGVEAKEGALFLDGVNRLVPEDDCLIVYGHNMKNKTMFGRLNAYGDVNYLRRHSVVRFDTLYENRRYVAFAAFTASMEPGNRRYFDVRKFIFDDVEFDKFVLKLQSRSMFRIPVDVRYGDRLLLLVTCDYTNTEGRFILALRQIRPDETEADMWSRAMQALSSREACCCQASRSTWSDTCP